MQSDELSVESRCPLTHLSRRSFLASAGALAAAAGCSRMGGLEYASALLDEKGIKTPAIDKARIRVAFVRPDVEKYWMGWPGAAYDIRAHQRQYTKIIKSAAAKQAINLELISEPLHNPDKVNTFLQNLSSDAPDGILIVSMCLHHPGFKSWRQVNNIAANKGKVPMVIFSPMGTSFTEEIRGERYPEVRKPGVAVGATQDVQWLATGLRMLNTIHLMKNTRICIARGDTASERKLDVIGTTLHYIPGSRFVEELKKVQNSDEIRAMADYYRKNAKDIVEPTKDDILTAAKNYTVCRRLMAAENCHGFSMDCLGPITRRLIKPPCMAFSRLRDEGGLGTCEADWNAAISTRLTDLLFERPGFMQDPAPNTANNTLMGAHCTCATRLDGFDKKPSPFILRSHSESNIGVAMQVLWKVGQKITIMKFQGPEKIILGTGTVLRNIDTPPSGGCRTSLEVKLDNVPDSRDVRGFHQLFIYGDLEDEFKNYCQLAGIEVQHIHRPRPA